MEQDNASDQETESECPLCQEFLPENSNLKDEITKHLKEKHHIVFSARNYPICDLCNMKCGSLKDMIIHLENTHQQ